MSEPLHGRGASANPANRFERVWYDPDAEGAGAEEWPDEEKPGPQTIFFDETPRSILSHNDSPDVGFDTSVNPYRGCEHGCIYCYARPTHEYLGWSAGLDFETKIVVKRDAPILLRKELLKPSWKPQVVSMSGVTDCYQPIERKLAITRACLEVFLDFRNPVGVVTKNHLVTRDIDILQRLATYQAAMVYLSVTTLDPELARLMEPRASIPTRRLEAVRLLAEAGVPVGVLVSPIIPGLNDTEIPAILDAAKTAGAVCAHYRMIGLPYAVKDLFVDWVRTHYPEKADKVISKIKQVRGGQLYDADFTQRMSGQGPVADQVEGLFRLSLRKTGLAPRTPRMSTAHFRRPVKDQLDLFG